MRPFTTADLNNLSAPKDFSVVLGQEFTIPEPVVTETAAVTSNNQAKSITATLAGQSVLVLSSNNSISTPGVYPIVYTLIDQLNQVQQATTFVTGACVRLFVCVVVSGNTD